MPAGGAGRDEELGIGKHTDQFLKQRLKRHLYEIYGFRDFRDGNTSYNYSCYERT